MGKGEEDRGCEALWTGKRGACRIGTVDDGVGGSDALVMSGALDRFEWL